MFCIKIRWCLNSNCGPQASEATAMPTEPQPQPNNTIVWVSKLWCECGTVVLSTEWCVSTVIAYNSEWCNVVTLQVWKYLFLNG